MGKNKRARTIVALVTLGPVAYGALAGGFALLPHLPIPAYAATDLQYRLSADEILILALGILWVLEGVSIASYNIRSIYRDHRRARVRRRRIRAEDAARAGYLLPMGSPATSR